MTNKSWRPLGATVALAILLVGCAGSAGATQTTATQPAATQAAPASAAPGQTQAAATQAPPASGSATPTGTAGGVGGRGATVTLGGALAKTYTTQDAVANPVASRIIVAIFEPGSNSCSLSLRFPADSPPGQYKVGNRVEDDPEISALYTTLSSCSSAATEGDWVSTDGTLTLTESGPAWSGTFDINVAKRSKPTDTVPVTGSFTGLTKR